MYGIPSTEEELQMVIHAWAGSAHVYIAFNLKVYVEPQLLNPLQSLTLLFNSDVKEFSVTDMFD